MKLFIRIIRTILGLALLVAFAYGLFIFAQAAPKSGDYKAILTGESAPVVTAAPAVSQPSASTPVPDVSAPGTDTSEPPAETVVPAVETPPEPTPLPTTPEGRAAAMGLPAPPEIDVTSWEYVLVNGEHSIEQYKPEQFGYLNPTIDAFDVQTTYNPNRVDSAVDVRIGQALLDMCVAAEESGLDVYLTSCYRSYESQADNFLRVCAANGVSDGKDADGHYITMPAGCSEHQSGLCADIVDKWYGTLRAAEQRDKPLQIWLAANCQDYGFILRFPEGKEDITGVMYEPWHFRYVGETAAKYIMENNLCLEEFLSLYDDTI